MKDRGQFYTKRNPFEHPAFMSWLAIIPKQERVLGFKEPFAGAGDIPGFIQSMGIDEPWKCWDKYPVRSKFKTIRRDTLNSYPTKRGIVITNPPWGTSYHLARIGLREADAVRTLRASGYDDLYKFALDKMLSVDRFVAALLPDSFLGQHDFKDRLFAVVSLPGMKPFDNTLHPTCLALFVGNETDNFQIWSNLEYLGNVRDLEKYEIEKRDGPNWKFNDPKGKIGLITVDGADGIGMMFVLGDQIDPQDVDKSSRVRTRISGVQDEIDTKGLIDSANDILQDYRSKTKDVFLTTFRWAEQTGKFRKRLDYRRARMILNLAQSKMGGPPQLPLDKHREV